MTTSNIIVVGVILALLSILSLMLLKLSSKEYPKTEEEPRPKFEAGTVSFQHCTDTPVAEKPKRKYKKKRKKKPVIEKNLTTDKRPVGRPKKSN